MSKLKKSSRLRNQSGAISTEFVFGFFVTMGLMLVVLAVSYTLSILEISQYIIFSTSRAHMASNLDAPTQRKVALTKYKALTSETGAFGSLFTQGWFTIDGNPDVRGGTALEGGGGDLNFSSDLAGGQGSDVRGWFLGASAKFVSNMMTFHVPFLGVTSDDDDAFATHVSAMLIRESSQSECKDFFKSRADALSRLPAGTGKFYKQGAYVPLEDNGC